MSESKQGCGFCGEGRDVGTKLVTSGVHGICDQCVATALTTPAGVAVVACLVGKMPELSDESFGGLEEFLNTLDAQRSVIELERKQRKVRALRAELDGIDSDIAGKEAEIVRIQEAQRRVSHQRERAVSERDLMRTRQADVQLALEELEAELVVTEGSSLSPAEITQGSKDLAQERAAQREAELFEDDEPEAVDEESARPEFSDRVKTLLARLREAKAELARLGECRTGSLPPGAYFDAEANVRLIQEKILEEPEVIEHVEARAKRRLDELDAQMLAEMIAAYPPEQSSPQDEEPEVVEDDAQRQALQDCIVGAVHQDLADGAVRSLEQTLPSRPDHRGAALAAELDAEVGIKPELTSESPLVDLIEQCDRVRQQHEDALEGEGVDPVQVEMLSEQLGWSEGLITDNSEVIELVADRKICDLEQLGILDIVVDLFEFDEEGPVHESECIELSDAVKASVRSLYLAKLALADEQATKPEPDERCIQLCAIIASRRKVIREDPEVIQLSGQYEYLSADLFEEKLFEHCAQ